MVDPSDIVMNTARNENKNTCTDNYGATSSLIITKKSASFSELEKGFVNFETFRELHTCKWDLHAPWLCISASRARMAGAW